MLKPSLGLWATAFSFSWRTTSLSVHTCLYMRAYIHCSLTSILSTYVPACVYPSLHLSDIPVSCYLSPTHILSFKAVYLSLSFPFQLVHSLRLSLFVFFCLSDGPSTERNYFSPQYLWLHLLFRPLFSTMSKPRQMSHRFLLRSLTAKTNCATYRMCSQVKNYQMKQQKNIGIMCLQSGRISASAITVLSVCTLRNGFYRI